MSCAIFALAVVLPKAPIKNMSLDFVYPAGARDIKAFSDAFFEYLEKISLYCQRKNQEFDFSDKQKSEHACQEQACR